ncbi:MAG: hypothetical protein OXK76_12065 [Gammaproteobacteria bacterium]|nr:hypothetical protein [Gammaproteobacteria bacterium]
MNRHIAFPFLTLSDAAVDADPWCCSLNGGEWNQAGEYLADWDAASAVRFRRTVSVDPVATGRDLGVAADDLRLALGIRVGTGAGGGNARLPQLILRQDCIELEPDTWCHEFDFEVAGERLSLVLDLQTQVLLAAPPKAPGSLTPNRSADRLWVDTLRTRLEGEEPRFPIEIVNLRRLLGDAMPATSPWYLQWPPGDWNRDFHGAVRLYLNEDRTDVIERVEQLDGPTLQALLADVMSQVVERLLNDPDAEDIMANPQSGSLGDQATAWLRQAWDVGDVATMRSTLQDQPGRFRAAFLALAEPGKE